MYLSLFWKKSTANAALIFALLSIPLSAAMKCAMPGMPFLDRMGWVFATSVALIVVVSIILSRRKDSRGAVVISRSVIQTDPVFAILAFGIMAVTAALYVVFWPRGQEKMPFWISSSDLFFYCYILLLCSIVILYL